MSASVRSRTFLAGYHHGAIDESSRPRRSNVRRLADERGRTASMRFSTERARAATTAGSDPALGTNGRGPPLPQCTSFFRPLLESAVATKNWHVNPRAPTKAAGRTAAGVSNVSRSFRLRARRRPQAPRRVRACSRAARSGIDVLRRTDAMGVTERALLEDVLKRRGALARRRHELAGGVVLDDSRGDGAASRRKLPRLRSSFSPRCACTRTSLARSWRLTIRPRPSAGGLYARFPA